MSDRVGLQASPLHSLGELKGLVWLLALFTGTDESVGLQASPLHSVGEMKGLVWLFALLTCANAATGNVPKLFSLLGGSSVLYIGGATRKKTPLITGTNNEHMVL